MQVVIVGTGNVATVLGKVIQSAGHKIMQVLGRNEQNAKALANIFGCESGHDITTAYKHADVYLFAISDNALHHLYQNVHLGNKLVVHTAGSVSKDVLNNISGNYGVIYPLQSLNKDAIAVPDIPLLIDGNSAETIAAIQNFAQTFSDQVSIANDDARSKFHIAAVIVSNFVNHLYALTHEFCVTEKIDFKKLMPLLHETAGRMQNLSPRDLQTGPAVREDIYTLGKHLQLLTTHPDLKYIYLKLTESILKFHHPK